jgi:hypothetical protein
VKGCESMADVRRKKGHEHGDRYLVCAVHGRDMAYSPREQAALDSWIDEHGQALGQGAGPGEGQEGPEPSTPATAGGGQAPVQKRAGLFSFLKNGVIIG